MNDFLTRIQFDILDEINRSSLTKAEEIAEKTKHSIEAVDGCLQELCDLGYAGKNGITEKGISALEPYRVKRVVFIAAGFGSRMVPITLNTPKPLVRVHGVRMIDTMLDAVLAAGIREIYIVRGYLGEQFDQLLYKYPMIQFIDNPLYNDANNISSAMLASHLLCNSYVCEADLVLANPALFRSHHYRSNFLGIYMEHTDDWCFDVKSGMICGQIPTGGDRCYQEVGISYWNEEDGKKLDKHLKAAFEMPDGKNRYWDQVPLRIFADKYQVELRECQVGDIVEIDSFNELKAIDESYDV